MKNWRTIRRRAERLLEDSEVWRLPVPVDEVAKRLGLAIVKADLGGEVSGLLVRKGNTASIFVEASDSPTRRRFTVAHELGHYYLGHDFGDEHVHVDRGYQIHARGPKSTTGTVQYEVEANQFAAALLMPESFVRAELDKLGGPPARDDVVARLAKKFWVSEQAMTVRLSVLNLL